MVQSSRNADSEQVVEPMLALARCSIRHRIVVMGTHSAALMFALHRRGYAHVPITANSPSEERQIRSVLGKCGLSVETGTAGDYGLAISAWRECAKYKPKLL